MSDTDDSQSAFTEAQIEQGHADLERLASKTGSSPPNVSDEEAAKAGQFIRARLAYQRAQQDQGQANGQQANGNGGGNGLEANAGQEIATSQDALRSRYSQVGEQYGGDRQIWDLLSYPPKGTITGQQLRDRARRQGPAKIIAETVANTSWKIPPKIVDDAHDDQDGEIENPTQFEQDVQALYDANSRRTVLEKGLNSYFTWIDRWTRPCRYGISIIGFDDGNSLEDPIDTSEITDLSDITYLKPVGEERINGWTPAKYVEDDLLIDLQNPAEDTEETTITSPGDDGTRTLPIRPDQPAMYEIEFPRAPVPGLDIGPQATTASTGATSIHSSPYSDSEGDQSSSGARSTNSQSVHYSRVVHLAEREAHSEWIGESPLIALWNRFIDYEKTQGSSAEMFWRAAEPKHFLSASSDADSSGMDEETVRWIDNQFTEMNHNMRNTVYTEFMEHDQIGGQTADPSAVLDSIYQEFAGVSGIPQRMMKGSERGDLASSMDESNFFGTVEERQQDYAEPGILRPHLDRFIAVGAMAAPDAGSYTAIWPSLFELTEQERAEIAETISSALANIEDAAALGADRETAYKKAGLGSPGSDQGENNPDQESLNQWGADRPAEDSDVAQDQFNAANSTARGRNGGKWGDE